MTAKEQLRAAVEDLTEAEAAEALELIARGRGDRLDHAEADEAQTKPADADPQEPGRDQPSRGDRARVEQVRAEFSRQRS